VGSLQLDESTPDGFVHIASFTFDIECSFGVPVKATLELSASPAAEAKAASAIAALISLPLLLKLSAVMGNSIVKASTAGSSGGNSDLLSIAGPKPQSLSLPGVRYSLSEGLLEQGLQ
jgi:hypothetical protein